MTWACPAPWPWPGASAARAGRGRLRGAVAVPLPLWARGAESVSTSADVESLLEGSPDLDFTIGIVAREGCEELERCVSSIQRWLGSRRAEVIVGDNGFEDACSLRLDSVAEIDPHVRVFHAD